MIREALAEAEALGAVALRIDAAKDSLRVTALEPNEKATKVLQSHVRYLTAVLGTRERIELSEVRRLLGETPEFYQPQTDVGKERERLMKILGWPKETLTLEALRSLADAAEGRP